MSNEIEFHGTDAHWRWLEHLIHADDSHVMVNCETCAQIKQELGVTWNV